MADKIIAPIAMLLFIVFVASLAYAVNELDLWIVIGFVTVLAAFDFWESIRQPENGTST